ncbi:MAG: hypothetical protein ABI072_09640 [Edaphobacter sp.]
MPVPIHLASLRRLRWWMGVSLLLCLATAPALARGPEPAIRIPLAPLGFQPLIQEFLAAGGSMLTLHFVDDTHVLLTFNARTLLKRIPNDPPEDQDRNVAALLLELPSGRVLARTEWRFHDHGQYLWALPHGRFLLRVRDTLTTFAPLANLATPDPFLQRPFLPDLNRHIGFILFTPDADMMILETKSKDEPTVKAAEPARPPLFGPAPHPANDAPADTAQSSNPTPVLINFLRISSPPGPGDEVMVRSAGSGLSRTFGTITLTTAGHLETIDQGHQSWAFNFNTYTGKVSELAAFDSTCQPFPLFVSHSEFIAFGCRGGQTPQILGGFNMRGEQMWQQGLFGDYIAPRLVFSPSSGRFAMERAMTTSAAIDSDAINPGELTSQTVVVYQTDSGDQLLKVDCSPIERAGQNFAISADGLSFGVIRDNAVEIYKLPPLTKKQKAAVERAQASAPEEVEVPVRVFEHSHASTEAAAAAPPAAPALAAATPSVSANQPATQASDTSSNPSPGSPANASPSPAADPATPSHQGNVVTLSPASPSRPSANRASQEPPPPPTNTLGDPPPDQPRKRPTLYTLPTDPPHSQSNGEPR